MPPGAPLSGSFNIRLRPEVVAWLKVQADRREVSVNALIREAVSAYIRADLSEDLHLEAARADAWEEAPTS